jgi:hypothetical protein
MTNQKFWPLGIKCTKGYTKTCAAQDGSNPYLCPNHQDDYNRLIDDCR